MVRRHIKAQIWSPEETFRLKIEYSVSFYFFSTTYVPSIDLGIRNSVVNETKSLSSCNLYYGVCGGGREIANK